MDLTFNNYLRGTGNGPTWHVDIDPPNRPVASYFEETIKTAEYIYANKTGKLYVLYSGGMDSEYVCNVLLYLKIPFTPVIIKLQPSYNDHDVEYAYKFCRDKNLKPVIFDIDYDKFVKTGKIVEIAESMDCCSLMIPATMHVAEQLDGFVLMGNDPPYMRLNQSTNTWQLEEEEVIHSIMKFFHRKNLQGCPFFLSYTPEMLLSFLLEPSMKKLANHRFPGRLGTNSTKIEVFNNGSGFNMENRIKFTGYETILKSEIFLHENIQLLESYRPKWNGCYKEDYHKVVERLSLYQLNHKS